MNTSAVFAYRKAWKALNTMLEEGRSYSGFERNCAFLNMGPVGDSNEPRFAEIAGACGLDVMDDGRSIAVVDWDFDGKLDFWISNRTAPRLRLQHNRSRTPNGFVSVKLKGKSCNRDAIGARVELMLRSKKRTTKLVKTVRAGEGFLAQSSSWVHFGIPQNHKIESLTVRWPQTKGAVEKVAGISAGGFFLLHQGSGKAERWIPPAPDRPLAALVPAEQKTPSEKARIVMASPLPLPECQYVDLAGNPVVLSHIKQPTLINLWATWCAPCVAEMKGWTSDQENLKNLGVRILALSVDQPNEPIAERTAIVKPFLKRLQFPFEAGLAGPEFLEVVEVAGRAQIDKYEALPVPSSILLDAQGRMAVIYKGPVEASQLAGDVALLAKDQDQRHREAAHFPGVWIDGPWAPVPTGMIDKFLSSGQPAAAKKYLDQFTIPGAEGDNRGLAESYFLVASELRMQKKFAESIKAYAYGLYLDPGQSGARQDLAMLLFRMRQYADAIPHLRTLVAASPQVDNTRKMLALSLIQTNQHAESIEHMRHLVAAAPKDAVARLWLGHSLARVKKPVEAEAQFREGLRLQPGSVLASNELAWMLATHTSAKVRKTKEALKLATNAAEATKFEQPRILDTLAAAQAANGDYARALKTVDAAIELAQAMKDETTTRDLKRRRKIYESGRPYREIAPVGP